MPALNINPTEKELEILQILWMHGPSSVRFVNESLISNKPIGYTTTLKTMQIMADKGILSRTKSGKTHIYEAILQMDKTQKLLTQKFMSRVFQGSAAQLVMQVLGNSKPSLEDLQEVKKYISDLENNN